MAINRVIQKLRIPISNPTALRSLLPRLTSSRLIMTSCENLAKNVQLTCSPLSALVDKKVRINVRGLEPNQKITLQAKLVGDVQDRYRSMANYIADDNGEVCLSTQPSVGGTYVGVEPMGFIWSLKPEPGQKAGRRLMKRDVTKPYVIDLDVLDGHELDKHLAGVVDNDSTKPLCSLKIKRHYMGAGVRRIEVRVGRVRGTLFLPPGEGPFQGVIDLIGSHGGLVEFKAALLASHGFATLSLAYLYFDDLPNKLEDLELEYFLEAVDWFKNHPQVIPGGVGVMGISKGAEIGLLLAANCKDVAALVFIGGTHGMCVVPISHKGVKTASLEFHGSKAVVLDGNVVKGRQCYEDNWHGRVQDNPKGVPVENIQGSVLLVYGADDCSVDSELSASIIYNRMKAFGKGAQCTILGYHGTGHLIEPPYSPHAFMSFQKSFNLYFAWGGEDKPHAVAQEHSWSQILAFFQKQLPQNINSKLVDYLIHMILKWYKCMSLFTTVFTISSSKLLSGSTRCNF